jgi:hypothetical protein
MAHRQHFAVVLIERDDRRLVENDAFALGIDQRVGSAEIDCEVAGQS